MIRFALLVFAMLLATPRVAFAIDLIEVFQLARESEPALQAAGFEVNAARAARNREIADFLPDLGMSYSTEIGAVDRTIAGEPLPVPDIDQDFFQLQLRQPIWRHDNITTLDSAKAALAQSDAAYEEAYQTLLLTVAERYFEVLTAKDVLAFAEAEERALQRQLEQSEQRYEVGLTPVTDVFETRASFDAARARVIAARNRVANAREALIELVNVPLDTLVPLREDLPVVTPEPDDPEDWVSVALDLNPRLKQFRENAQVAEAAIRTQRARRVPAIDLVARYSDSSSIQPFFDPETGNLAGTFDVSQQTEVIGIEVSMPLFQGGAIHYAIREAVHQRDAALSRLEGVRREVVRDVRNAYRGWVTSLAEVDAREQAVASAESALSATEAGFDVGTRTIVDVLLAQRQLFQAQSDYSAARHDYVLNTLRLQEAVGSLERADLAAVNSLLSPERRYELEQLGRDREDS